VLRVRCEGGGDDAARNLLRWRWRARGALALGRRGRDRGVLRPGWTRARLCTVLAAAVAILRLPVLPRWRNRALCRGAQRVRTRQGGISSRRLPLRGHGRRCGG